MEETRYRIVQLGDAHFIVEKLVQQVVLSGPFWRVARHTVDKWMPADSAPAPLARPFRSQEAAQKWINDKRTYPIVVKEPA